MDGDSVDRDLKFGPFELSGSERVLRRDGEAVPLGSRALDILCMLAAAEGEVPQMRSIRFRTQGDYPLTGAIESTAATLPQIIQEMLLTTTSERQGRAIDHDQAASMEKKKQEGYF